MRVCMPVFFVASAASALAAVTNVSIQGTTPTQAILHYTAPDEGTCTVEVSESPSFSPLVHDVDPTLYVGANLDIRREGTFNGAERVFVIGKRRAERAGNGHWYSRALQAFTRHYYRITCGTDQATGDFTTSNILLGNTYNDELPPDPDAGKAGYFVNAGEYAWPEFVNWDKATGRSESIIDPQTGMLLKRITMPGDQVTGNRPSGDHTFTGVANPTGGWNNPANVQADDSAVTTFSGSGRDWLVLHDSALSYDDYYLESFLFSAKAWCSGACGGDDAKIQVCLTVDGLSCWPSPSNIIDVTLGTTANPSTYVTAGSSAPLMAAWTPVGRLPLNATDTKPRSGNVDVDASGNVTNRGGDVFYPNWTAGSRITIAGSDCAITKVTHTKSLAIDVASCSPSLTLPVTNGSYKATNFGVMIRKKTTSTDTISIQYAKYTMSESIQPQWPSSGSPELCSDTLTQNAVTGALGYRCVFPGNQIYWIDHVTGDANYLGMLTFPTQGGTDGWSGGGCLNASTTLHGNGPLDPEKFYCPTNDNAGKSSMLTCTLTSTNQPGNLNITCVNLTKGSLGQDMQTLIQQFTAGYTPSYDTTKFGGGGISGMQNGQVIIASSRGYQDSIGWVIVFDPEKIDTAPGCVGGGKPGCVVGAQSSWANAPARWCVLHTLFMAGNSNTSWILGKYMVDQGVPGTGPHTSTVVAGNVTSQPSIAPGVSGCTAGSKGCDLVVVDGEPCNMNPAGPQGGHPGEGGNCPKNSAWEYLQDAQPGDMFSLQGTGENIKLLSKNGNSWLLERGFGYSTPQTPPTPVKIQEACQARRWDYGAFATDWLWDFQNDPHAVNASGTTVRIGAGYAHPAPRPNATIGTVPVTTATEYGYGITDGPGYLPANKFSQMGPAFASVYGVTPFNESSQDHPSHPQNTAPPKEQKWFLDARPLTGPGASLIDAASTVSGQLYKFSSTSTDGDNLTRIGGPNAYLGGINRKLQPTMARCGTQPLNDVSSATQGNTIADDASSAFQYCIARRAGECRTGSARGDVYVNCPYVAPRPVGTVGCDFPRTEITLSNDICLYNTGAYLNQTVQFGYEHSDPTGALARGVTKGLNRYNLVDPNQNVHGLPDGSWLLLESNGMMGTTISVLAAKMPPYPEVDSVNRQTFIPLVLNLTPPQDLNVDNAVLQFGYLENGTSSQFFCTTRREACMAVSPSITESNPFRFPSEGSDGTSATVTGVSCQSSCSIAIPALPQRVVYYQVLYRDAANNVVAQTPVQMAVTP
jgi:hypothetical protein